MAKNKTYKHSDKAINTVKSEYSLIKTGSWDDVILDIQNCKETTGLNERDSLKDLLNQARIVYTEKNLEKLYGLYKRMKNYYTKGKKTTGSKLNPQDKAVDSFVKAYNLMDDKHKKTALTAIGFDITQLA